MFTCHAADGKSKTQHTRSFQPEQGAAMFTCHVDGKSKAGQIMLGSVKLWSKNDRIKRKREVGKKEQINSLRSWLPSPAVCGQLRNLSPH